MAVTGYIHSFQSLGTVDGPGVRFVAFLQGCSLRCKCCHNPDTWDMSCGKATDSQQLVNKALRYREYFGVQGGITLSGGEPLMQAEFAYEVFETAHKYGINTCLDTSGCVINDAVKKLLTHTDRVLLDIKYTSDSLYLDNVGCSINRPLEFLSLLDEMKIPTTLRQVIIPTLNDNEDNILSLKKLAQGHKCVDKIELLPFKKLCTVKYDDMGLNFPLVHIPEPTKECMDKLNRLI